MSPRAAWRLERLGFSAVYDYVAGKADWLAAGLATERNASGPPRAVDVVDHAVPVCDPGDEVRTAAARAREAGWETSIVLNDRRIVLGRLRLDRVDTTSAAPVEEVMEPGPATVRADADVGATVERLRGRGIPYIVVTTPDGELVGVLHAGTGAGFLPA